MESEEGEGVRPRLLSVVHFFVRRRQEHLNVDRCLVSGFF